jgi:alkanesulfonate monooxygenase SsuD/methylene tetrahydromethanopterin reductase-like flavin-dependent oxidoreductase (luciferase family)
MKLLFTEKRATFKGRYHSIEDAYNSPKPLQQPHPPITIGGSGEKVMLRIVAKYADRWNCPAGYRSFERKFDALKEHCKAIGRDINTINISEQLLVCLGNSEAEVEEKWKAAQRLKPFVFTGIKGTPPQLVEHLRARVRQGITFFTVMFSDFGPPQTIETFAREVMPAFV